ncbi:hypothetical protein RCH07_003402 [Arthrobacter sp. CG_A4]|nr:hypothetical protein [Arthrobacter sp. CG_A4]
MAELNTAIDERVAEINGQIRRVDGSTRYEQFSQEEAHLLQPLPPEQFGSVEWKQLKAARNYHVCTVNTCPTENRLIRIGQQPPI